MSHRHLLLNCVLIGLFMISISLHMLNSCFFFFQLDILMINSTGFGSHLENQ